MTLKLCGFAASNYFNQVKLQLLEKEIAFIEEEIYTFKKTPEFLANSPLGKVPFLVTEQGAISESMACSEYIEAVYPQTPLLPKDPFAAAKVRELIIHMILDLELPSRVLHPQALWGGKLSENLVAKQKEVLQKGIAGFARLVKFSPYIAGDTYTLADCAAASHLAIVGNVCKIMYGEDLLLTALPNYKDYLKILAERPAVKKMAADRKVNSAVFIEKVSAMVQAAQQAKAAQAAQAAN